MALLSHDEMISMMGDIRKTLDERKPKPLEVLNKLSFVTGADQNGYYVELGDPEWPYKKESFCARLNMAEIVELLSLITYEVTRQCLQWDFLQTRKLKEAAELIGLPVNGGDHDQNG